MTELPHLALTSGEPAGIGPDLCLFLSRRDLPCRLTLLADINVLKDRAKQLGLAVTFCEGPAETRHTAGSLNILSHPVTARVQPGHPDTANARHVLTMIETATLGCMNGRFDALVTAPVHKGILNEAGIPFSGHTEYIASLTGGHPVMMLATPLSVATLRVALVTTHLPLSKIPAAITPQRLRTTIEILHHDLQCRFGLPTPRMIILGLNPHAGEGGHLGREEIEVISPVLAQLRLQGMNLNGPIPADTAFLPHQISGTDAYLAMYHDQGLPVLKFAGFGRAVNVTLGLPIIRTSVDHGTAFDLAGSGRAEAGSLLQAINTAIELAGHAQFSS